MPRLPAALALLPLLAACTGATPAADRPDAPRRLLLDEAGAQEVDPALLPGRFALHSAGGAPLTHGEAVCGFMLRTDSYLGALGSLIVQEEGGTPPSAPWVLFVPRPEGGRPGEILCVPRG